MPGARLELRPRGGFHEAARAPAAGSSGIEKRGHGAATSLTAMDITIHATFLPHNDPDASLAFYRDTLGFEVRNDVGYGGMHWITVGPPRQPRTSIVLYPPGADPRLTHDERRTLLQKNGQGNYPTNTPPPPHPHRT